MTGFALIPLFAGIVNFTLAIFAATRDLRLRSTQVLLLWTASLGLWNIGATALFRVADPHSALFWARVTMLGVLWLPVGFAHVSVLITQVRVPPIFVRASYLVTLLLSAAVFSAWYVAGVRKLGYGVWFSEPGPLFFVYAWAVFPAIVLPTFVLLVHRYRTATRLERRKLRPLIGAEVLLCALGMHDMAPIYGLEYYPHTSIPIYPWGSLAASLYGLVVANALLQDQLLDLRLSLGRQAATVLRLLFLLAAAYIILAVFSVFIPGSFTLPGFVASLLAIGIAAPTTAYFFPRLLGSKSERLEQRILGDRFEYHDQILRFSEAIPSYSDAVKLLADTREVFRDIMRISSIEVVILDARAHTVRRSMAEPPHEYPPIGVESPLVDLFIVERERRFLDCRNFEAAFWEKTTVLAARDALVPRTPDMVYGLRTSQGDLVGLLLCGRKTNDAATTPHDMELTLLVCKQLGYAFERMQLADQAALSERLETVSLMSRGLAHDLPNAVMPISTFLELTDSMLPASDERRVLLDLAKRNTSNILAYAHEAMFFVDDFHLRYSPIDLDELFDNVVIATASRAAKCGVRIERQIASGVRLEGDFHLLQRLLANLVSNACDASPPNSEVVVVASTLPDTRSRNGWIRIEVTDRGTGIDPALIQRIFEPYYSTKTEGDGTRGFGLGLAIAQKIVLLHGGAITVRSEVNHGTTFAVDLPARSPIQTTP